MKTYQDMNNEEIKEQLEWSDQHEFSYGYSMWAFKEIERLNNIIEKAIEYINNNIEHEYRNGNDNEFYLELNEKEMNNLLDILKGSDKE